ncbi:hypothetical protein C8F04DRAFT_1194564 [Mycena alexandri]|uniref:Uncharacterized protein n=1 Tax=Mycena alexandri TaxID=1745969 RepID=A0AAD6WRH4_9AGAR|nr:hypothetical protein C8F04DRAFT_1194564 [Mycena alexandri]
MANTKDFEVHVYLTKIRNWSKPHLFSLRTWVGDKNQSKKKTCLEPTFQGQKWINGMQRPTHVSWTFAVLSHLHNGGFDLGAADAAVSQYCMKGIQRAQQHALVLVPNVILIHANPSCVPLFFSHIPTLKKPAKGSAAMLTAVQNLDLALFHTDFLTMPKIQLHQSSGKVPPGAKTQAHGFHVP